MKKLFYVLSAAVLLFSMAFMTACGGESPGTFYSLQEAYNNEWLTQEDLQTIANYHNNNISYPESLSEGIAKSIKKVWAKQYNEEHTDSGDKITGSDVSIRKYYGTYHDCAVVIVDRRDAMYLGVDAPYTIEVGGVAFTYNRYRPQIIIWKN